MENNCVEVDPSELSAYLTSGQIKKIVVNPDSNSIIITMNIGIDNTTQLTLGLPRELIDSKTADGSSDQKFSIIPAFDRPEMTAFDPNQLNFEETNTTDSHRYLRITIPAGATSVEIVGTQVVPEFETAILIMVLIGGFATVIGLSRKSTFGFTNRILK